MQVTAPESGPQRSVERSDCMRRGSLAFVFIGELASALVAHGVPYCVVGGVAVNLHGVPRMTFDVDIVVALDRPWLEACSKALASLGLAARVPVQLGDFSDADYRQRMLDERSLRAVTFTDARNPLREVDVIVSPAGISVEELIQGSVERHAGALALRIISLDDLLRMKRAAGRPQDLADVAHLERIRGS